MSAAQSTPRQATPPDPHRDRPAADAGAASRTGRLLGLLRKLIDYGKQLAGTLRQRPSPTDPTTYSVMRYGFATRDLALILARITRGLLLADALEARLIQGAAREQDAAPVSAPSRAVSPRKPRAARPAARHVDRAEDPRLARLPTPEAIAAEVRRRPIGAVLADICRDLGIVPAHPLWRELNLAIMGHGGNATALLKEMLRRGGNCDIGPPPRPDPGWLAPWPQSLPVSGAGPP